MRETDDFSLDVDFGKWLSELRKKSNLSIQELSSKSGLPGDRIRGLELGYSERAIKPSEVKALCQIYKIPVDEMMKRALGE